MIELKHPLGFRGNDDRWRAAYCDVAGRFGAYENPHRLLARWLFRIPLESRLHVHHRDGDFDHNHITNLVFGLTNAEHGRIEGRGKRLRAAKRSTR